jgi:hypothetical protein
MQSRGAPAVSSPGKVATPIMLNRPIPPAQDIPNKMLQPDDLGKIIAFVADMPFHGWINEILVPPTWNRTYLAELR